MPSHCYGLCSKLSLTALNGLYNSRAYSDLEGIYYLAERRWDKTYIYRKFRVSITDFPRRPLETRTGRDSHRARRHHSPPPRPDTSSWKFSLAPKLIEEGPKVPTTHQSALVGGAVKLCPLRGRGAIGFFRRNQDGTVEPLAKLNRTEGWGLPFKQHITMYKSGCIKVSNLTRRYTSEILIGKPYKLVNKIRLVVKEYTPRRPLPTSAPRPAIVRTNETVTASFGEEVILRHNGSRDLSWFGPSYYYIGAMTNGSVVYGAGAIALYEILGSGSLRVRHARESGDFKVFDDDGRVVTFHLEVQGSPTRNRRYILSMTVTNRDLFTPSDTPVSYLLHLRATSLTLNSTRVQHKQETMQWFKEGRIMIERETPTSAPYTHFYTGKFHVERDGSITCYEAYEDLEGEYTYALDYIAQATYRVQVSRYPLQTLIPDRVKKNQTAPARQRRALLMPMPRPAHEWADHMIPEHFTDNRTALRLVAEGYVGYNLTLCPPRPLPVVGWFLKHSSRRTYHPLAKIFTKDGWGKYFVDGLVLYDNGCLGIKKLDAYYRGLVIACNPYVAQSIYRVNVKHLRDLPDKQRQSFERRQQTIHVFNVTFRENETLRLNLTQQHPLLMWFGPHMALIGSKTNQTVLYSPGSVRMYEILRSGSLRVKKPVQGVFKAFDGDDKYEFHVSRANGSEPLSRSRRDLIVWNHEGQYYKILDQGYVVKDLNLQLGKKMVLAATFNCKNHYAMWFKDGKILVTRSPGHGPHWRSRPGGVYMSEDGSLIVSHAYQEVSGTYLFAVEWILHTQYNVKLSMFPPVGLVPFPGPDPFHERAPLRQRRALQSQYIENNLAHVPCRVGERCILSIYPGRTATTFWRLNNEEPPCLSDLRCTKEDYGLNFDSMCCECGGLYTVVLIDGQYMVRHSYNVTVGPTRRPSDYSVVRVARDFEAVFTTPVLAAACTSDFQWTHNGSLAFQCSGGQCSGTRNECHYNSNSNPWGASLWVVMKPSCAGEYLFTSSLTNYTSYWNVSFRPGTGQSQNTTTRLPAAWRDSRVLNPQGLTTPAPSTPEPTYFGARVRPCLQNANRTLEDSKPLAKAPIPRITVHAQLFRHALLKLPKELSSGYRYLNWYRYFGKKSAVHVSKVTNLTHHHARNWFPTVAEVDFDGTLVITHLGPSTIGTWLVVIVRDHDTALVKYRVVVPAWQQALVNNYTKEIEHQPPTSPKSKNLYLARFEREIKPGPFDPTIENVTWTLLRLHNGSYLSQRVCQVRGLQPTCLCMIDDTQPFLLTAVGLHNHHQAGFYYFPPYSSPAGVLGRKLLSVGSGDEGAEGSADYADDEDDFDQKPIPVDVVYRHIYEPVTKPCSNNAENALMAATIGAAVVVSALLCATLYYYCTSRRHIHYKKTHTHV